MKSDMQLSRQKLGSIPFTVSARVAMQLGRESISSSIVAIIELVKNAYDADAGKVEIKFVGLDTQSPSIVIEDDGNGMSLQELLDCWMLIGTSKKLVTNKSDRKRRILIGEKGLGRLGLDRLCRKTIIQSFTVLGSRGVELFIDWSKYEGVNDKLENISHDYYSISKQISDIYTGKPLRYKKGTRLILQELKDEWTAEYLKELKQELSLLISPFAGINDFCINLESGIGLKDIDGNVTSTDTVEAAEWKIRASIDDKEQVIYSFESPIHKNNSYQFKPTPWKDIIKPGSFPRCGPLSMTIYFYPRQEVELGKLKLTTGQIKNFLDSNQGIRIYRDNFRVSPYGQPDGEGDWLKLSFRRQASPGGVSQSGYRVGYNQVVGSVFIKRGVNKTLNDQTNREGILEGDGFNDLRRFALKIIEQFEYFRRDFEQGRKQDKDFDRARVAAEKTTKESQKALDELRDTQKKLQKIFVSAKQKGESPDATKIHNLLESAISEVGTSITKTQEAQKEFVDAAQEKEELLVQEKNTLGNLASLGILTTSFGHETLASTNLVAICSMQLKRDLPSNLFMVSENISKAIEENLNTLTKESHKIDTFANFALKNITRDKRKRKNIYINRIAKDVFSFFKSSLDEKNIKYTNNIDENVPPILGFEIDWESIFVNFITNSIWAIVESDKKTRVINLDIKNTKAYLEIIFSDSGKGLEKGTEDKIFEPGFSTKRNQKGEVTGTGMGLAIVKNFVESYDNASIVCISPCKLGGVEFDIRLPE
ncbi:MAG: sensor histidine kinase [Phycisphaerae bacterium]|jgi:hypothetical protein